MKKTLMAIALAVATIGTASAHRLPSTHYHNDAGRVVIGNTIAPQVDVRTETDRFGRDVRVTTTTSCVEHRVNRRNRHIRCVEEETRVDRVVIERPRQDATVEPRVQRFIERDENGRRIIVTVTDTCTRTAWQNGQPVCYRWERDIDRQYVRWNRDHSHLDLDGDGRDNQWERLLFQKFREILESN